MNSIIKNQQIFERQFPNKTPFSKKYIQNIIKGYYSKYSKEKSRPQFKTLLNSKRSFTSRKNFSGHVTASAVVLDQTLSQILLVEHKSLGKFIQPGGHVDDSDPTLCDAALRELYEETGLNKVAYVPLNDKYLDIPFDIDVHTIPKNEKKQEPEHLHFDFRYLFVLLDGNVENLSKREIKRVIWGEVDFFDEKILDLNRVSKKVKIIISERHLLPKLTYILQSVMF